jgi:hypothetical protein
MVDDTGYTPIDWHAAAARQHRHNMQLLLTAVGDTDILDDEEQRFLSSVAFNGGTPELASIMHKLQNPGRQPTADLAGTATDPLSHYALSVVWAGRSCIRCGDTSAPRLTEVRDVDGIPLLYGRCRDCEYPTDERSWPAAVPRTIEELLLRVQLLTLAADESDRVPAVLDDLLRLLREATESGRLWTILVDEPGRLPRLHGLYTDHAVADQRAEQWETEHPDAAIAVYPVHLPAHAAGDDRTSLSGGPDRSAVLNAAPPARQ